MAISPLLRIGFTGLLLGLLMARFGEAVLARLLAAQPTWLALALAITVAQTLLSAWRWRYTARRLDLPLGGADAVGEYYLGNLVNQLLPGGVLGDANRAWRHGRTASGLSPAFQAVVIERVSGQLAMLGAVMIALIHWPAEPPDWRHYAGAGTGLLLVLATGGWLGRVHRPDDQPACLARWRHAVGQALLQRRVLGVQLATSALVVASYVAVYACCLLAIGIEAPASVWLPLIPLILLAMLIPLTVGGWGLREGAAAAIWPLAGLSAEQGISGAVVYGLVCLIGSTPGLLTLLRR
ncbi:lysylphosphatidylglycerol synthase transmembrane domain-containing protein [Spiribacter sp. 218]|uniref:lysylphosphatidylglycerol synthase transmembrane domain-containing protein n=1 Tax=Spiribacter pallidus TaxID=1987936 RepID=UPI00349FA260